MAAEPKLSNPQPAPEVNDQLLNAERRIRHGYAQVGDVRLHYAESGDAARPLVLLLHGFPECWYSWRHQLDALGEQFHVVAPDLRGYNLSDKPAELADYHMPRLVDDVLGLIRHFGAGEAAIVGHDWGAAVAWASARAHPGSVSRLVAMQVPPFRAWHDNLSLRQLSRSWYILFFQLPRVPEWWIGSDDFAQLAKMFRATSRRGTFADADIAVYKEALSRCSASGETTALTAAINYYRANVFRMAADADAWTPVRVPTLFIYGERDQFVVPETVRGVNRYVESPYSEVRLARAGHWVQQEYPNEVNAALIKFLSGGVSQREGEKGKG